MRVERNVLAMIGGLIALYAAPVLAGEPCVVAPPFDRVIEYQGKAAWQADGENCRLVSSLASGEGSAAAAAAFQLSASKAPLRIGFRLDRSQLSPFVTSLGLFRGYGLLTVTSDRAATSDNQTTGQTLLTASVFPAADGAHLRVLGACQSHGFCAAAPYPVLNLDTDMLRFEVTVGGPGEGRVRYWINTGFEDPPTGELVVDNAAWGVPAVVALGLQSPGPYFRTEHAAESIVFDQIEVPEGPIFWDNFESWHTLP